MNRALRLLAACVAGALLACTTPAAAAEPGPALQPGERFTYWVGWGIFGKAGEIVIEAEAAQLDGRETVRVRTHTATRGIVRGLYTHENDAEVFVDRTTGRLLASHESGRSGKRRTDARTDFDYDAGVARHRDAERPGRNADLPFSPDQIPVDLISALIQAREWRLQVGDKRDVLVHFGRDLFPVTIRAEGTEDVRTPMGRFRTTVLVPRMETEPPRGLFARGGEIKVWIAEEPPHLPVRMQLQLNFGQATLSLENYTPPHAPGPDAAAPSTPAG